MAPLRKNSIFGFLGFLVPTLVLFICYPVLVKRVGAEALGIYFLATSISGTLAFLDVGFGGATVKFLAEDVAEGRPDNAAQLIVASYFFYGVIGIIAAAFLWLSAPMLLQWLKVSPSSHQEGLFCFRIAAIQFAASFLLTPAIAVFKGLQQFRLSTSILSLLSLLTYGGATLGSLFLNAGLSSITLISLCANLIAMITAAALAFRLCRGYNIKIWAARPAAPAYRKLFGFGSVMTFNSISTLLLTQVQKYIISATIGPAAVTSYQLASVIPQKVHAAVGSFSEAMFPAASGTPDKGKLRSQYLKLMSATGVLVVGTFIPMLVFAKPALTLWIGAKTADQILPLFRIFILAYFFMAFSPAPYYVLNGIGKPWVNTLGSVLSAVVNITLIAIFGLGGLKLASFAWAFAIACIAVSVMYQAFVEVIVWRRWFHTRQRQPELSPA